MVPSFARPNRLVRDVCRRGYGSRRRPTPDEFPNQPATAPPPLSSIGSDTDTAALQAASAPHCSSAEPSPWHALDNRPASVICKWQRSDISILRRPSGVGRRRDLRLLGRSRASEHSCAELSSIAALRRALIATCRSLDRQLARARAPKDANDVVCRPPAELRDVWAVAHHAALFGHLAPFADRRQARLQSKRDKRRRVAKKHRGRRDQVIKSA